MLSKNRLVFEFLQGGNTTVYRAICDNFSVLKLFAFLLFIFGRVSCVSITNVSRGFMKKIAFWLSNLPRHVL
jgi:hypothetical protein